MLFMVILIVLFRWLSLFLAGSTLSFLIFQRMPFVQALPSLGFALFVWFLAKGIDALIKPSVTFKFLSTRKKRIIAAIISFAMGLLLPLAG